MNEIMIKIAELVIDVDDLPQSREKSLILTKLNEARHWARDLQARNQKEQLDGIS